MSSENEENHLPDEITELDNETQKTSKISYTRDFLLSFSDLDACKKLPSGFDQSLLSEFEDTSQDRQRTSGGLFLSSFKRSNEYGSSPPTRGDSSSYSRGVHGRWEGRSVRSDKDSDSSQSDLDSDSTRRYGNQSKRSWQVPEHDGLLGSGSFPRPTGYASGSSAPKARPNEHYQLNRSTEPYQPPRPYKAVPHSRRDTDAFNDETFGSSEHTSKDRAEEERKRRASFELMRKEHHKSFQDKKFEKNPDDFDISTLADESNDEKRSVKRGGESEELVKPPAKSNDPEKSSIPSQTPASRPLVPPGFNSTAVDRSSGPKAFTHSHSAEVGNAQSADNLLQGKSNSTVHTTSDDLEEKKLAQDIGFRKQQRESLSSRAPINNQSGKGLELSSVLDVSNKTAGAGSILYDKTNIAQASEASKSGEGSEHSVEKVTGPSILGGSNQEQSASILDKLFSSSLALNETSSSPVVEHHDSKANEVQAFQSSKFARWFNEEEKKPGNDQSSGRPNELLSLIVGEQGGPRVSGIKSDRILPNLPFQNSDIVSAPVGSFDQLHIENKPPQPVSAVLTCEDLEQSMLSEVNVDDSVQIWTNNPNGKTEPPKANSDNLASRHLLSLLQMSPDSEISSNIGNARGFEEPTSMTMSTAQSSRDAKIRNNPGSANSSLTLETLFGSAFMKELQSVGAPVSSQRGAPAAAADDPQLPEEDSLIFAADPPAILESLRSVRANQELPFHRGGSHPYQNPSSQPPPPAAFAQLLRPQVGVQFPQNMMNSQMKFMGPPGEGVTVTHHHEAAPPSHQMPMNMARPQFHHQGPPGLSGFDQPIPHHVLQQQRHMQGNFSPNLHQGPPARGLSMPPHLNRNAHPNFGGLGMPMQGPDVGGGSNHPEALQRLIEMELRSNPKQIHPFGSSGQSRGNLGHELDMGFGFR